MTSHEELMAAKIALLEQVAKDLLANHFLGYGNPVEEFQQYAEKRKAIGPNAAPDPSGEMASAFVGVWSEFLDGVSAAIAQERAR